ncbi:unnamed protein product, partial [Mesorhabditis belari]|uniref:Uncharacterized protein n=1 Tax=Mesorhabditis belari TaxID=2138241 RepID=A0AAF3F3Z4_9BILA
MSTEHLKEVIFDDGPILPDEPFHRRFCSKISLETFENIFIDLIKTLGRSEEAEKLNLKNLNRKFLETLVQGWRKSKEKNNSTDGDFQCLLLIVEFCLSNAFEAHLTFENLISALGFHTVQFWRHTVPHIFDSDLSRGTKYRDALLFSLTLYDVNTGKSRLKELYAAVPGIRKSLLGVNAKQFVERFHHLQKRLSRSSSTNSLRNSAENLNGTVKRGLDEPRKPMGTTTRIRRPFFKRVDSV